MVVRSPPAKAGVRLIVSVDTGIRANEVVRHASALGIDVIVTDHHLPEAELPPAAAVLNPNRADCSYPEKNLCGAGVAFKLIDALTSQLGWDPARRERVLDSLLKQVAIATRRRRGSLTGENRVIVKRGLEGFTLVRQSQGSARCSMYPASRPANPRAPARSLFQIAPRINAAGSHGQHHRFN